MRWKKEVRNQPRRRRQTEVLRSLRGQVTTSLQLRHFALRFIHSHSGATGVFRLKCHFAYFQFAVKMADAISKIEVCRLKVGDLIIKILVHFTLLGLVFLVLGRS